MFGRLLIAQATVLTNKPTDKISRAPVKCNPIRLDYVCCNCRCSSNLDQFQFYPLHWIWAWLLFVWPIFKFPFERTQRHLYDGSSIVRDHLSSSLRSHLITRPSKINEGLAVIQLADCSLISRSVIIIDRRIFVIWLKFTPDLCNFNRFFRKRLFHGSSRVESRLTTTLSEVRFNWILAHEWPTFPPKFLLFLQELNDFHCCLESNKITQNTVMGLFEWMRLFVLLCNQGGNSATLSC